MMYLHLQKSPEVSFYVEYNLYGSSVENISKTTNSPTVYGDVGEAILLKVYPIFLSSVGNVYFITYF